MRSLVVPAAVILVFSLPTLAVALWPKDGGAVVVLATPRSASVVAAAGGTVLALHDDGEAAVTRPVEDRGGFVARLRAAGARIVVAAPDDLACLTGPSHPISALSSRETQR